MFELDENLRQELLARQAEDFRVREELAQTGELFDGYHPTMEAIHLKNAARLEELIAEQGWPGQSKVGADGAEAAWLIAQHAISRPDLSRDILPILEKEAEKGEVPLWQVALPEDRINFMEGKPQRFGSQFDWNERNAMSPHEIFEPEKIDERRAAHGLFVPYSDYIEKHNEAVKKANEPVPQNYAKRKQDFLEWARKTGWRD